MSRRREIILTKIPYYTPTTSAIKPFYKTHTKYSGTSKYDVIYRGGGGGGVTEI